jgi:uncharacterized membrane protein YphA (DoxX/SURF4 family)
MTDDDLWRAAGVNPPTPRRSPNMPTVNLSPGLRLALYIVSALGSLVAAYLFAKGLVGEAETALWAGVVALINAVAAANVNNSQPVQRNERGHGAVELAIGVVVLVILVVVLLRLT